MEWVQFIIFFIGVFGLFIWNRAEGRADSRHFDNKLELYRSETNAMIEAIRQDMKDFHNKLLEIERRKFKS